MAFLKKVLRYYKVGSVEPLTVIDDNVLSVRVRRVSKAEGNSMDIIINNPTVSFFSDGAPRRRFTNIDGSSTFEATKYATGFTNFEERIEFYAKYTDDGTEDIVDQSNLLFSGQIGSVEDSDEPTSSSIKLTCSDRTFNILNRIASQDYPSSTVPLIAQDLVRVFTEGDQFEVGFDKDGNSGKGPAYKYPLDARLFSEGIKQSSTSVSASSTKVITATGASFLSNGVSEGDMVRNTTTNQVALVRSVDSETQLTISKALFSTGANIEVSDGFIQDFRPDGSPFPTIAYGNSNKPIYEWFTTLGDTGYTNSENEIDFNTYIVNRPLKIYVDGRNRLHMFIPDNTPSIEIEVGNPQPIGADTNAYNVYKSNMKKSVFDVVNYITFKCGEDMNGRQISWFAQDPFAGNIIIRDSFRPYIKVSENMKFLDFLFGNISHVSGTNFDYPASYPIVPAWDSTGASVNSDSEYNKRFREVARKAGVARAMREINQTGKPRWKGNVEIKGFNLGASDLVRLTNKAKAQTGLLVRIDEIAHNLNKGGWYSTLSLKEDVSEIK